jgi:hypothetical protein
MAFFRRTICITERNDRLVLVQLISFYKYFWTELISYKATNIMNVCVCILVLVIRMLRISFRLSTLSYKRHDIL